eukprot:CAMPEP_0171606748 /NCGR_PEP_ID=MMETSP0990-20121206/7947_1 /TAXON_ID=483369 /ORGANISM="non described non described, Strain CCMP2098" /LENGTH=94 /DNA_ID=CAMNT_0012169643 /DNA_START=15 /DNA_END=299 /DNA_ORIENTATION=+
MSETLPLQRLQRSNSGMGGASSLSFSEDPKDSTPSRPKLTKQISGDGMGDARSKSFSFSGIGTSPEHKGTIKPVDGWLPGMAQKSPDTKLLPKA